MPKADVTTKQGVVPCSEQSKGNNAGMLRLLENLISNKDDSPSENKDDAKKCVQDDLFMEQMNRVHDLSEEVYWSEDEREGQVTDCKKASAHVLRKHFTPREYVMQDLDPVLDGMVANLLFELNEIQNRHRSLGVNSNKRRSLFLGLREVLRAVRNRRIKCVIVAPDILEQDSEGNGNHEEIVREILRLAYAEDIPVVFALTRSRLGRSLGKLLRTSMIGVLDAKGANDHLQAVVDLAYERRLSWLAKKSKVGASPTTSKVGATPAQLPPWRKVARAA
jgi:ribosomal protein L7Ae-like RNA K-turn-binding protein